MGLKCEIKKEHGGHCTGWDGKLESGKNAWGELEKVVEKIPCDTCKIDGQKGLSAFHDVVNLTIGETRQAFDPKNLKQFAKRVNKALEVCTNCHEVE